MSRAAQSRSIDVGAVIANTYEIAGILGRGGMGTVWEATHLRLPGKRVAIKILHANVAEDPESLARFRREAEIACRLGHPNIVEVHDFNHLDDGSPYLILEMLEGQSLDQRLREGLLDLATCEHITRQIASALQCAHEQGVIHRDLKPQNIFLVPSATGEALPQVKVLDFGISKIRGSQTVKTQDSTLLGTPQYMAPEQATGNHEQVDARTDLFALAAMLYELLSGKAAFSGQSIPEVVYKVVHVEPQALATLCPNVPAEKCAALHKALSKSQDERFPDIASFVETFTGTAMAAPRPARAPRVAPIGNAETIDSSKIDFAQAATFDSRSQEMPAAQLPEDAADPIAETIDSNKLDKLSVELSGEKVEGVKLKSVRRGETTLPDGKRRTTYLVTMMVVCGAALALFLLLPASSDAPAKDRQTELALNTPSTQQENHQEAQGEQSANIDAVVRVATAPALDAGTGLVAAPDAKQSTTTARHIKQDSTKHGDAEHQASTLQASVSKLPEKAEEALRQAEIALKEKRPEDAKFAADRAYRVAPNERSFIIKAKASCLERHLGHVNAALRRVDRRKHAGVKSYCSQVGFPLH